jgi:NAD(P)-dependent dehydrogenase (short-subunit alcohol dehydrogenase family)
MLMRRLEGKVAIVTGAARGIGRATAELFAREAAMVYATDCNYPDSSFDYRAINFSTMDVANDAHWQRLVGEIVERHGAIDILVNNAGIGGSLSALADETLESWNQVIAVNQTGVFLGMRAVLPNMLARRKGSIVNISSIWAMRPLPSLRAITRRRRTHRKASTGSHSNHARRMPA